MNNETPNERVKIARKALNLTLEKFGSRIGVTKTAISLIESGKNTLTEKNAILICKEFGIDYFWLTTGEGDMFAPVGDDEIIAKFDAIMAGEKDTHKIILKTLLDMDEEMLKSLDRFIEKYIENKKAD